MFICFAGIRGTSVLLPPKTYTANVFQANNAPRYKFGTDRNYLMKPPIGPPKSNKRK